MSISIKKRLLKRKTVIIGYTGTSLCVRIPADVLKDAGMELGERVKLDSSSGTVTVKKLLPKEKKILGVSQEVLKSVE